ncbi:MAG: pyridoxamine 5'-phosphate oxidase [Bacteroidales bacterium]
MEKKDLTSLRQEYAAERLEESQAAKDPFLQFATWFDQAMATGQKEPNAMTLATSSGDGKPSARVVLLKEVDERGFVFFTNYQSQKGRELAENPYAALVFLWLDLHRQVRIQGRVEKISQAESDAYFASRPRESQLGALASPQSMTIKGRELLEKRFEELREIHQGKTLPRPGHWGGYRLIPTSLEFWQGRESRLHDRLLYTREEAGWKMDRLAP